MSASNSYQAILIGSGQGGTPLRRALASAGFRTALAESLSNLFTLFDS
jgi:pyruvate/2-oxoglutarate dehydrogenase complex dihydrolipoamide dehydrogenase (E3) component